MAKTNKTGTNLVALFDTARGACVKLHRRGCRMLNTASTNRRFVSFDWTEDQRAGIIEQGLKITTCKCAK